VGHLDACLECADAYARLYELEVAARAGTLPQGTVPAADLSFLAEAGTKPSSSLAEQLGQALRRSADGWTLQFSQALLGWLRPGLQPAAGLRSGEQARYDEVLYQLAAQEAAGAEPAFSLVVYRDAHAPERGLVEVRVEPEGRSWPDLGGYRVTLEAGGEARTMLTDAWGLASLENVALDGLMQAKLKIEAPARE
jgi:hypothetical protein